MKTPAVIAVLLILSAAVFGVGATLERSHATRHAVPAVSGSSESGESAEQRAAEGGTSTTETGEKIFGVNPETVPLTVVAIVASVLLAIGVVLLKQGRAPLLVAIIAFGVVFAVLDVKEALHQSKESNSGLLGIAIVAAVLHAGVSLASARGMMVATAE